MQGTRWVVAGAVLLMVGLWLLGGVAWGEKPDRPRSETPSVSTRIVPDDCPTIQAAIEAVPPGGEVLIRPGIYDERFLISKSVTLRGMGEEPADVIIQGRSTAWSQREAESTLRVEGDSGTSVCIVNLTVAMLAEKARPFRGFWEAYCLRIGYSVPEGFLDEWDPSWREVDALSVGGEAVVSLDRVELRSTWWRRANGLRVGDRATVEASSVVGSRCFNGMLITGTAAVRCRESQFVDCQSGVVVQGKGRVSLLASRFETNIVGFLLREEATGDVSGSVFRGHQGPAIWVQTNRGLISGAGNKMLLNGVDLVGEAPAGLRMPLQPETTRTLVRVPEDFGSLQEAVDAVAPGGTVIIGTGGIERGVTVWKPLTITGELPGKHVQRGCVPVLVAVIGNYAGEGQVVFDRVVVEDSRETVVFVSGSCLLSGARVGDRGRLMVLVAGDGALAGRNLSRHTGGSIVISGSHDAEVTLQGADVNAAQFSGRTEATLGTCSIAELLMVVDEAHVTVAKSQVVNARLSDQARGSFYGSVLTGKEGLGLVAWGSSAVVLEGCDVRGVSLLNKARIEGLGGVITNVAGDGLSAAGQSTFQLHRTVVQKSSGRGLTLAGEARGTLESCIVLGNGADGAVVSGGSRLELINCTFVGNRGSGCVVSEGGFIRAVGTSVSSNNGSGMSAGGSSVVQVEACSFRSNHEYGLCGLEHAVLSVKASDLSGNNWSGLCLRAFARAAVENCSIAWNGLCGLHVGDEGSARIVACQVAKNGWYGVSVGSTATLEDQQSCIWDNGSHGLAVWEKGVASLHGTEIRGNRGDGIYAEGGSTVLLDGCKVHANAGFGVRLATTICPGVPDLAVPFQGRFVAVATWLGESSNLLGALCPPSK